MYSLVLPVQTRSEARWRGSYDSRNRISKGDSCEKPALMTEVNELDATEVVKVRSCAEENDVRNETPAQMSFSK